MHVGMGITFSLYGSHVTCHVPLINLSLQVCHDERFAPHPVSIRTAQIYQNSKLVQVSVTQDLLHGTCMVLSNFDPHQSSYGVFYH